MMPIHRGRGLLSAHRGERNTVFSEVANWMGKLYILETILVCDGHGSYAEAEGQ